MQKRKIYNHKLFVIIGAVCMCLVGCNSGNQSDEVMKVLDVTTAIANKHDVVDYDIFKTIKYIPLETSKEHMVKSDPKMFMTGKYVVSNAFRQIYLFDRFTGEFIREIGGYGRGPEEYRSTGRGVPFDANNEVIYAHRDDNYLVYGINEETVSKMKYPRYYSGIAMLNDSTYASYRPNITGDEKQRVVIVRNGEIIHTFPNYQSYVKKSNSFHIDMGEGMFHNYNKKLYFKEILNDTLFEVQPDTLKPRYVFKLGDLGAKYEDKEWLVAGEKKNGEYVRPLDDFYDTRHFCESSRYLLFESKYQREWYWGCYDKDEKKIIVQPAIVDVKLEDGLIVPFKMCNGYINSNNQLVTYINGYELQLWFEQHEGIKLRDDLKKLKGIGENDNPVVIIAQLQE
ncbi:6-bladed beta-propeller [Puteibacter caeruleilacunae]|nr:6-bladed beta-propeller [Puteibacter caeruleilacunae]